jgi:lipoprotein NlpI
MATAVDNYDVAIADWTDVIRMYPGFAYAYVFRGVAYRAKGCYDLAQADYTQAIRLNPYLATVYDNECAKADLIEATRLKSNAGMPPKEQV